MALQIIYWLLASGCTLYALRWGGASERVGAVIIFLGSVATVVAASAMPLRYRSAEIGILSVDLAVFAGLLLLALRSARFWPLWVAAFQLVGVSTHVAMVVSPDVVPYVYSLVLGFWAYPMLLSIVVATRMRRLRGESGAMPAVYGSGGIAT